MTGRRRVARTIRGTREDAEVAQARLRVADHEMRLPRAATNAHFVDALLDLHEQTAASGSLELAPKTIVTL